jgi:diaminopimelate decarboxylase
MLNPSIRYDNGSLFCDAISAREIAAHTGTPLYIYSLPRALANLQHIRLAFSALNPHIHFSAKANASLALLKALTDHGAGIDAVSAGEIHKALLAGAAPEHIVFAGVGKTPDELAYAVQHDIGWFNVENITECQVLNDIVGALHKPPARIALRLNPEIAADTHPHIATGHGGAKFGLTSAVISDLLAHQDDYPHLNFAGIHVHIGSQLHDTAATRQAVERALNPIRTHPHIRTVNIGGGLPVAYRPGEHLPDYSQFSDALTLLLQGYEVLLEPGRAVIADAGILVTTILYVKKQAGHTFYITDASMTELIRPALYGAYHEIVPLNQHDKRTQPVIVVGPVCETTDVLHTNAHLPQMEPGEQLAILTAGAYGMVMSSNFNARPRPPEVVVDGDTWRITRRRETWDDLLQTEML